MNRSIRILERSRLSRNSMFRALNTFSGNNVDFLETKHVLNIKYPKWPISCQKHCLVRSLRHATVVFWIKMRNFWETRFSLNLCFSEAEGYKLWSQPSPIWPRNDPNKYTNYHSRFIFDTSLTSSRPVTMAKFNPNVGNDRYPQLSAQIQQKFLTNQQTSEIYDRKNQWREEIEGIVKALHPTCRLVLSGSSANGFGSVHSDIDLVLCFEGAAVTSPYMLRRIESLFTRSPRRFQTEVMSE